ncbi:MAG: hypothetical protein C0601_11990 [Candidatus Muiribacterium halophilum]|uniref:Radical SAM core domain-containing protein n=1 Tax=Muiribacterium halophilum TaxID=2053465 RepID=A0A2N5ZAU7_MUIH1|nr:MAG: hypothetical protein C0601_11990 [Candidatus Muirbacterium halophilum]
MLKDLKKTLLISLTESCNLNCEYCSQKIKGLHQGEFKYMDFELFQNVVKNIDEHFETISLMVVGESLLNPDFLKIFELLLKENRERDLANNIVLNTNGVLFTPEFCDHLLLSLKKYPGVFLLVFSLDANSPETFLKLKGKDLYLKVEENIKYLFKRLSEDKYLREIINVSVQSLILEKNKDEMKAFLDKWTNILDKLSLKYSVAPERLEKDEKIGIIFRRAIIPSQKKSNLLYEETMRELGLMKEQENLSAIVAGEELDRDLEDTYDRYERQPCIALFKYPVVSSTGKLCICCRDDQFKFAYGELSEKTFSEIFYSKKAIDFRMNHIKGKFDDPNICYDCPGYEDFNPDKKFISDYCNETGMENELLRYKKRTEEGKGDDYRIIFTDEPEKISGNILFTESRKKDGEYPHDNEDSLLCSYWFEVLTEKDNKLFSGCDRILIDKEIIKKHQNNILSGDERELPEMCQICKTRLIPTNDLFRKYRDIIPSTYKIYTFDSPVIERKRIDMNSINSADLRLLDENSDNSKNLVSLLNRFSFLSYDDFVKGFDYLMKKNIIDISILKYSLEEFIVNEDKNRCLKVLEKLAKRKSRYYRLWNLYENKDDTERNKINIRKDLILLIKLLRDSKYIKRILKDLKNNLSDYNWIKLNLLMTQVKVNKDILDLIFLLNRKERYILKMINLFHYRNDKTLVLKSISSTFKRFSKDIQQNILVLLFRNRHFKLLCRLYKNYNKIHSDIFFYFLKENDELFDYILKNNHLLLKLPERSIEFKNFLRNKLFEKSCFIKRFKLIRIIKSIFPEILSEPETRTKIPFIFKLLKF